MGFINPWILLIGVAAGIPVLFHLWKQKRLVPKQWGAFRLLVEVEAKSRRAQVERWLLLALRMAIILLLVLAFARPAGYYGLLAGGSTSGKHVVVVWDNSYSMARKINDTPMFELARQRILKDLDRLQFDKATLLLMAERPREPLAGFTSSRAALQELVETAEQSQGATNVVAALRRADLLLAEEQAEGGTILLYHDFQANGWRRDALEEFNSKIKDRNLQLGMVQLKAGESQHDNQSVSHLEWSHDILSPDMPLKLSVVLHNHHAAARRRTLTVEMDGVVIHQQAVTIPAPREGNVGKQVVEIPLVAPAQGPHRGNVRLSADALSVDNLRHFAFRVVPKLAVLLLDGSPQLDPRKNASFFAAHLLNTHVTGNIEPRVIPGFDVASTDFNEYDAVVLANVNRLDAAKFAELQSYVERGGGVVYFLGDQVDPGDFQQAYTTSGMAHDKATDPIGRQRFDSANLRDDTPSAAGIVEPSVQLRADRVRVPQGLFPGYPIRRKQGEYNINVASASFDHPLLRRLADVKGDLPSAAFTEFFEFEVLEATAVPLRLRPAAGSVDQNPEQPSGYPLVVERAYGAGRILMFTSSCDRKWNDMLLTPSTAPLLLQAVYYTSNAPRVEDFNRRVGDDVVLPFRFDEVDQRVSITRPDQSREDVFTRSTALGGAAAVYSQASQAGIYRFELIEDQRAEAATTSEDHAASHPNEPQAGYFAVSFVSDESNIAVVEPVAIAKQLPNADVTLHLEDLLATPGAMGMDGWLVFTCLGVVLICGECWLANKNV